MQTQAESRLLRIPEVARRLDVTEQRAYELVRSQLLPAVKLGRQLRVSPEALQAFIDGGGKPLAGGWKRSPEAA